MPASSTKNYDYSIIAHFFENAAAHPNKTAITQGEATISYGEINRLSANLASEIPQFAAPNSKVVAIHAERSIDLVIAILASIRAGYTFAVLDANYPAQRLNTQCEIISPALILHCGFNREDVQSIYPSIDASRFLHVDREKLSQQPATPALSAIEKNPVAYYLFTSGTTGKPKCIKTSHAPLNHFVEFYEREFTPGASDKFSMLSGVGHDPFLRDLFVPLSIGAEICIPPEQSIRNPYHLYTWLKESEINYIHGTPQLSKLIEAGKGDNDALNSLKYFFCGGDILRASHARSIFRIFPNAQLVNFYGATETPQAMGFYRVNRDDINSDQPIPLGKGIDDVELLILTADMQLAATGEKGEVGIRTRFLSDGYLHDDGMTAEKFVHLGVDLPPVYRTGDAGYKNEAGFIIGAGRIDDQVKIRGYRVELAEVNSAVERTGLVENAATFTTDNANGEKQLIAFVVPRKEIANQHDPAKSAQLKNKLAEELPSYMVPSQIFWLESLYLTPNGKVDKVKLLTLADTSTTDDEIEEITDPVQALIVEEWKTILSCKAINPTYSFVELGGDSLSFIQASLVVEEILGCLPDEWEQFSIVQLATMKSTSAKRPWSLSGLSVVTSVIVRALSIITVVADHFGFFNLPGGVVTLFIVAGWSFGRYSLVNITEKGSPGPIAKLVSRIALPTMLLLVALRFAFHNVLLTSILLVSNYDRSIPLQSFWFIEILVQIYAVLFILFSFKPVRKLFQLHTFHAAYIMTLMALAVGALMEFVYNTFSIYHRVPWHYIWGIFLGIAIAESKSRMQKLLVTATLLLCAITGILWSYPEVSVFPLLAILAVIWIKSIPLPKPLALVVTKIAMASLFIYITHFLWLGIFHKIHIPRNALVETILAVAGGIFAWYMWDQLSVSVSKLMHRFKH